MISKLYLVKLNKQLFLDHRYIEDNCLVPLGDIKVKLSEQGTSLIRSSMVHLIREINNVT